MDWIPNPTEDESVYEYDSARAAAGRYVKLMGSLQGALKGVDPAKMKMSFTNPKTRSTAPDGIWALDEYMHIQRIFGRSRKSLIRHRPKCGAQWWLCWWAVRIDGHKPGDTITGYSRPRGYEILQAIDDIINDRLVERQMYQGRCDLDAIEHYNAQPVPQVRFWEVPHGDEG
jgi:hypothetical protein